MRDIACTIISRTREQVPSTKIYIAFDVTDIIQKIGKDGKGEWNKENDGQIITLCVDE